MGFLLNWSWADAQGGKIRFELRTIIVRV